MKKISVAVAVDDNGGIMFNNRRLSRDRVLTADLINMSGENGIYISPYSLKIFEEYKDKVTVADDPIAQATDGSMCFIENTEIDPYWDMIDCLVIYKWNRNYPYDVCFNPNVSALGFKLYETTDLCGYSHEKITKEIYRIG